MNLTLKYRKPFGGRAEPITAE